LKKNISLTLVIFIGLNACSKTEEKNLENSIPVVTETAKSKIVAENGDIALGCRYQNSGNESDNKFYVLIYAPTFGVAKFGSEKPDGEWDPAYKISSKDSTLQTITFEVESFSNNFAKQMNPSAEFSPEKITVNRETLDLRYETNSKYVGHIGMRYKCDLLTEDKFEKHVKWVLDNTEQQKQKNKI
jgi:hypothetical protein